MPTREHIEKSATPRAHLSLACRDVDTDPTPAEAAAGNYRKGHWSHGGLNFSIENPRGSYRKGKDRDGNRWSNLMVATYGYVKLSEGKDGDHVDVFMGPKLSSDKVFVIDQYKADGTFDEHKCVLFTGSEEEARLLYLGCYSKGWKCGPVTELSWDEFKEWVLDKKRTKVPLSKEAAARRPVRRQPGVLDLIDGVYNDFLGNKPKPAAPRAPAPVPSSWPGTGPSRATFLNAAPEQGGAPARAAFLNRQPSLASTGGQAAPLPDPRVPVTKPPATPGAPPSLEKKQSWGDDWNDLEKQEAPDWGGWDGTLSDGTRLRNMPGMPQPVAGADGRNWFERGGGIQGIGRKTGDIAGQILPWMNPVTGAFKTQGLAAGLGTDLARNRKYYGKGLWSGKWDEDLKAPYHHGTPDFTPDDFRKEYGMRNDSGWATLSSPFVGTATSIGNTWKDLEDSWNHLRDPEQGTYYDINGKPLKQRFNPQDNTKNASYDRGGFLDLRDATGRAASDVGFWERVGGIKGILGGTAQHAGEGAGDILGMGLSMPVSLLSGVAGGVRRLVNNAGYLWSGNPDRKWAPVPKNVPSGGWDRNFRETWNDTHGYNPVSAFARNLVAPIVNPVQNHLSTW